MLGAEVTIGGARPARAPGLVGTSLMSLLVAAVHSTGWAICDMIRAVGRLATRTPKDAFAWGFNP